MNDARFDRPGVGDATGDTRPGTEVAPNHLADAGVAPVRDWTRSKRGRSERSLLLHWIDEKGSVVRLLTSTDPDAEGRGA